VRGGGNPVARAERFGDGRRFAWAAGERGDDWGCESGRRKTRYTRDGDARRQAELRAGIDGRTIGWRFGGIQIFTKEKIKSILLFSTIYFIC
jgi:hypothetical protein